MIAIGPLVILIVFIAVSIYLIRSGQSWMLGIILSVMGSVGVMTVCTLTHAKAYPFDEAIICWLVFFTIFLSVGLIMAIHGLKKGIEQ